jgi:hypothetical protein
MSIIAQCTRSAHDQTIEMLFDVMLAIFIVFARLRFCTRVLLMVFITCRSPGHARGREDCV